MACGGDRLGVRREQRQVGAEAGAPRRRRRPSSDQLSTLVAAAREGEVQGHVHRRQRRHAALRAGRQRQRDVTAPTTRRPSSRRTATIIVRQDRGHVPSARRRRHARRRLDSPFTQRRSTLLQTYIAGARRQVRRHVDEDDRRPRRDVRHLLATDISAGRRRDRRRGRRELKGSATYCIDKDTGATARDLEHRRGRQDDDEPRRDEVRGRRPTPTSQPPRDRRRSSTHPPATTDPDDPRRRPERLSSRLPRGTEPRGGASCPAALRSPAAQHGHHLARPALARARPPRACRRSRAPSASRTRSRGSRSAARRRPRRPSATRTPGASTTSLPVPCGRTTAKSCSPTNGSAASRSALQVERLARPTTRTGRGTGRAPAG